MIYLDLVSIYARYRGISRNLDVAHVARTNHWNEFFPRYEKYLDWLAKMDNAYDTTVLFMLEELRDELNKLADGLYEIILYSDTCEPFPINRRYDFLGFDVAGDFGESAIQTGNTIDSHFLHELNQNGLFCSRTAAEEFCRLWKNLIADGRSPWESEVNPRPFRVWALC